MQLCRRFYFETSLKFASGQLIQRAMPNAAAAAIPPMILVCSALRMAGTPVMAMTKLGEPLLSYDDGRVIVYIWHIPSRGWANLKGESKPIQGFYRAFLPGVWRPKNPSAPCLLRQSGLAAE